MFLNTLLLWGTALGSVPIIIHLLNKRRFRPVQWAAMEFLLQAIQKNSRRLQIRDLILMLLRTLAVVALALALARPAVNAKGFLGAGSTAAVILLDNSLSMGYHNGRETRFDVGKRMAKDVLKQLGQGSWCGLYTFNDDVRAPMGDPSANLAYIEQELDRSVQLSDGGTNIEKAIAFTRKLFNERPEFRVGAREVYIITDMQSRPWDQREVSADFKTVLQKLSGEANVYLINAGDGGSENAALMDFTPTDTLVAVNQPVQFVAKIKNFGGSDIKALPVDFYVDPTGNNDRAIDKQTIDIGSGEAGSITFEAKFDRGGDHRVEVRIGTDDRLTADNRRGCSIEVIEETQMLLVDGRDQKTDDPLSAETGFLRYALAPIDSENPDKQNVVAAEVTQHYRLADKNLLNYKALVLANVPRPPQATVQVLERQVKQGMGLIIFLGDLSDVATYETLMGENGAKLLPAKIGAPWGEAPTVGAKELPPHVSFGTGVDKLSHPIMLDFNNAEFGAQLLAGVKVHKAYDLQPLESDDVRVVAWLANGKPAIVERKVGSGFVLLFAFPPTTAWTNLPTQPTFAIIMMRAAAMLAIGNHPPKNLTVGTPINCLLPLADQNTNVKITPPPPGARKDTTPEVTSDGRAAVIDYVETDKAGFYEIVLDRAPKLTLNYALNPAADQESNLNTVLSEQIRKDYPDFKFNYVDRAEDFASKLVSERQGTELWPWLMAIVFICLALESFLVWRWAPRD
ncbi:MAG TPA: BatA domain-containing protein [Planctomycetota bacterium]|nr:BatA domain-containing protein [Planctomycetota bacterium]